MDERIILASADGQLPALVTRPPARAAPGVVVAHDMFGIDDDVRAACDSFAREGYVVVCPELFWRDGPFVDAPDASSSDVMRDLKRLAAFDIARGASELETALAAARGLDRVNGRAGLVGYGLGGLLACLCAIRSPIDVAVAFYPAGIENHLERAASLPTPLLLHLAGKDEFAPEPTQQEIVAALDPVPHVQIEVYPGCGHGFVRQASVAYDPAASASALACTLEFLRAYLLEEPSTP